MKKIIVSVALMSFSLGINAQENKIELIGNVGIGTTTPTSKLHIKNGGQQMTFLDGSNTSGYALSIGVNDDGVNIANNSAIRGFNFVNSKQRIEFLTGQNTNRYKLSIGVNDDGVNIANNSIVRGFNFKNENGTLLKISQHGNAALQGRFEAKEIKVSLTPTADFVFEEDYTLPTLEFIEKHIKKKTPSGDCISQRDDKEWS